MGLVAFVAVACSQDERSSRFFASGVAADPIQALSLVSQQEISAPDGAPDDDFGTSVAISGNTAILGANNKGSRQGAAYVFVQSGTTWGLQQKLTAPDGAPLDLFGTSVSISGDTAVVGAPGKASLQGAAYVFVRSGTSWSLQQKLTAPDGVADDEFGAAVVVQGNTTVVGAPFRGLQQGAAYVFVRAGAVWSQQREIIASDGVPFDTFGNAVALDVDTAVIGAPGKAEVRGAAYVYLRSGTSWAPQQEIVASDGSARDRFGAAVAINAGTAVVGAPGKARDQGAAYVYLRSGSAWGLQQEIVAGDAEESDVFGSSVAIELDTAVVGAPGKASARGAAYAFSRTGASWSGQQEITASDGIRGDFFGNAAAINGGTVVVGAPFKDFYRGAAYVFAGTAGFPNGTACTAASQCASGFCADGVCCNTACAAGACDACSVAAGAPVNGTCALLTGTACNDGNLCTRTDTCQQAVCVGSNPVVCTASDQCHLAGTCSPATGACSNPTAPNGTACTAGACTQNATCQGGVCTPGVVQPTCVTIRRQGTSGTVADALIATDGGTGGRATQNYGASASLTVGSVPPGQRQTLIRFDLSVIPAGASITSATVTLTRLLGGGAPVRVHRVTAPWSEATVTWNSFAGAFSPVVEATFPDTATTSANLTSLVQAWVNGTFANDGILLERNLTGSTTFASSEYILSARPRLDVCYVACP